MARSRQTLEQWIHEALTDLDKLKPCSALSLVHRAGVREQEIHTTQLGTRQWNAQELAKMFLGKAENYAAELPGTQTFNLLAFYGGNPQWEAIKPFMVAGQEELPGLSTEAPTKEGLVQQAMRHTEAMTQAMMRQTQVLTGAMNQMFEQVVRENLNLRRENQEATVIVRDAMLQLTGNREDSAMKRLEFERASAERAKWLSFGPAFVNTLLGREVFPQSTADSALIDTIADNISEDDIQKLAATGVIKPEVWGPLAARMAKSLERKRVAKEQAAKALAHVDPEVDAMGGAMLTEGSEAAE
jgi:hypothetical protein